jgi:hypothetical protein
MFGQREEAKNLNCVLIYFHWFGDMNNLYKDLDNKPQIKKTLNFLMLMRL